LIRVVCGLTIAVAVLVGCMSSSEPLIVEGTVVDGAGQPVQGAVVLLDVFDGRIVNGRALGPLAFSAQTTTGPDGHFEFRSAPTEELRRLVGPNVGFVNFSLAAADPRRRLSWSWNFSRELGLDGWMDQASRVRLQPDVGP
jgi:hypothetical protein